LEFKLSESDRQSAVWSRIREAVAAERENIKERLAGERDQIIAAELRGKARALREVISMGEPDGVPLQMMTAASAAVVYLDD